MTIQAVFSDDREPEVQVILDRNYQTDIVEVTCGTYGTEVTVKVPLDQFRQLTSMIGL